MHLNKADGRRGARTTGVWRAYGRWLKPANGKKSPRNRPVLTLLPAKWSTTPSCFPARPSALVASRRSRQWSAPIPVPDVVGDAEAPRPLLSGGFLGACEDAAVSGSDPSRRRCICRKQGFLKGQQPVDVIKSTPPDCYTLLTGESNVKETFKWSIMIKARPEVKGQSPSGIKIITKF